MCGSAARPDRALETLEAVLHPKSVQVRRLARGFNSSTAAIQTAGGPGIRGTS
jgi:S-adenosylmethionine/arginine decarboxylase-like enzyme